MVSSASSLRMLRQFLGTVRSSVAAWFFSLSITRRCFQVHPVFTSLSFRVSFASNRLWSLPASACRIARTPGRERLHLAVHNDVICLALISSIWRCQGQFLDCFVCKKGAANGEVILFIKINESFAVVSEVTCSMSTTTLSLFSLLLSLHSARTR